MNILKKSISRQILDRGYYSIKLQKEGQKALQSHRYSEQILDRMFIKIAITEIDRPDHPSKQITQKVFQNLLKRQGWTFIKEKTVINCLDRQNTKEV